MSTSPAVPPQWHSAHILSLAPDHFVTEAARRLTSPVHWPSLSHETETTAVWGECVENRQQSQHVIIDLSGPAFYCTCPSYKFPCKHAIGLFLLYAEQPDQFKEETIPGWVNEWLSGRDTPSPTTAPQKPRSVPPNRKRDAQRQAKITAGLQELERWLQDLLRHGIAHLPGQGSKAWEQIAARMVDAGAVNVARELRQMATIPVAGRKKKDGAQHNWPEKLLHRIGRLQLLIQGFKNFDQLPAETQADLRAAAGWLPRKNTLTHLPTVADTWSVVGTHIQAHGRLRIKRRWLIGTQTKQTALLLDYAHGREMFRNDNILPGLAVPAELIFYPSASPLRAFIAHQTGETRPLTNLFAQPSIGQARHIYAQALTQNPWLDYFHFGLDQVIPIQAKGRWYLQDSNGDTLLLKRRFTQTWHLLALSGGRPLMVFGEWDGQLFHPFSTAVNGRWHDLTVMKGVT